LKKETELKVKEGENTLNNKEEAELEGIAKLLKELKEDQKYWQQLIKLATKQETTQIEKDIQRS
jgi:transcriptional regulator of heat shock response